jgi:hypothetical protein
MDNEIKRMINARRSTNKRVSMNEQQECKNQKKNSEGLQKSHKTAIKHINNHFYSNGEVEQSLLLISKTFDSPQILEVSFQ